MQLWKAVRQNGVFDEIEDFARRIKELGEHHSLSILGKFGNDLLTHVACFDIDRIEASLDDYPHVIERLKNYKDFTEEKDEENDHE